MCLRVKELSKNSSRVKIKIAKGKEFLSYALE